MRNENRLTFRMQVFLRGIRDRLVVLPVLLASEKVKPHLLARWLRHPYFRQTMSDMVRELRTRVRLELDMLAASAVRELARMMETKTVDEPMVAMCRTILEAHHRSLRFYRATSDGRRRASKEAKPVAERELCHPDSRGIEDELLAILDAPEESKDVTPTQGNEVADHRTE